MTDFTALGDPHLGRKFRTGVPLHRIGNREALVWDDFENSLMNVEGKYHINMGDLFDKFVVAPEVVLRAADAYIRATVEQPGVDFFVIRGNHDSSRDSSKASSFDIFTQLVGHCGNITIVDQVMHVGDWGFVPYDPFTPVADQVEQLRDNLHVVFMHHDYTDFGGDHVIPTKLLANKGIELVVNGHDHVQRTETRHGVTVEMVGSMQPYTHAEDSSGEWYVTLPLAEVEGQDFTNLNLRVLLQEGEALPNDIECLSMVAKRVENLEEQDLEADTADFESFDISTALSEAVHPDVREEIMEKFNA